MIFERRATVSGNTTLSVNNTAFWEQFISPSLTAASGEKVTEDSALGQSVVFRAVTLIGSIGTLPLKFYRRMDDGGKQEAFDDPLYEKLHDAPNDEHTAVEFWELMFGHLALRHNAYAQIIRDGMNRVESLWPLDPRRMTVGRVGGRLVYTYQDMGGKQIPFQAQQILHLRGMMTDGLTGISPFRYGKDAIGIRQAQQKFTGKMLANGARYPIVYTYPGVFKTNKARKDVEESLQKAYHGSDNAGKFPLLEQGLDVKTVGMSAEDAEIIQQQKFSIAEVARFLGVPLSKLMELDRATWGNYEEQSLDWVTDGVRPWCERVEARIKFSLIPDRQKRTHFAEFVLDDLLRADSEARWNAYTKAFQMGVPINRILAKENMNPVDGGDISLVPLNMMALEQAGQTLTSSEPEPERSDGEYETRAIQERLRLRQAHLPLFRSAYESVVKREVNDIRRNLKRLDERADEDFQRWVQEFYRDLKGFARRAITPVVLAYAENVRASVAPEVEPGDQLTDFAQGVAGELAKRYVAVSQDQILSDLQGEDPAQAIEDRLAYWDEGKAESRAKEATVDAGEAVARTALLAAGFLVLKWRTVGDNCPLCTTMNGRTVRGPQAFANNGDIVEGEGVSPFPVKTTVKSPPLHKGCDCMVVPSAGV